ncbi:hypothetical protein GTW69_30245, partial [Streptomyces sp. SID7760]|nr:hypothetical protein [Streptomyces sp. SID7760]
MPPERPPRPGDARCRRAPGPATAPPGPAPVPAALRDLAGLLRTAGLDPTAEELADALWL